MDAAAPANRPVLRAGRYAVYDEIAHGGMATVHIGRFAASAGFARTVAIKRTHPQYAKAAEFVTMVTDEARLAARLRHPNVVSTLDVVSADGELLLVMEYIHGESLANVLKTEARRGRVVPVPIAVAVVVGALYGLHAAHEATTEAGQPLGVIHRDVSPQNIIVGADGVPRVVDFGIAKAVGRLQVTREGEVKGKTAYMAPEQISGESMDRRVDVYAASVVLWEALTGHRLFVGDSPTQVLYQVLSATVEPPSAYAPSVPREVDDIVLRGIARDPDARFSTALEMAAALEGVVVPATAREVAAWLREVAGGDLDARAARIERIERLPADGDLDNEQASGIVEKARSPEPTADLLASAGHTAPLPPELIAAARPRRRRWIAASALAMIMGIALAVAARYASRGARGPIAAAPSAAPAGPATAEAPIASSSASIEPAPPPAPSPAPQVTLAVESNPSGVQIAVDGRHMGTTPAQIPLPRSEQAALVELSLRGFSTLQRRVTPNRDQALYVTLTRERAPTPRRTPKPDAPSAGDFKRFE